MNGFFYIQKPPFGLCMDIMLAEAWGFYILEENMNRFPQCMSCKYRGRTKCLKDMKPIETTSMIFGRCKKYEYKKTIEEKI